MRVSPVARHPERQSAGSARLDPLRSDLIRRRQIESVRTASTLGPPTHPEPDTTRREWFQPQDRDHRPPTRPSQRRRSREFADDRTRRARNAPNTPSLRQLCDAQRQRLAGLVAARSSFVRAASHSSRASRTRSRASSSVATHVINAGHLLEPPAHPAVLIRLEDDMQVHRHSVLRLPAAGYSAT